MSPCRGGATLGNRVGSGTWGVNGVLFVHSSETRVGFPGGAVLKDPPARAGDTGSVPGLGRSPGGGNGHPLQYSCLENSTASGPWKATVHGVAKSQTRPSTQAHRPQKQARCFLTELLSHLRSGELRSTSNLKAPLFSSFSLRKKNLPDSTHSMQRKTRWSKEAGQAFRLD